MDSATTANPSAASTSGTPLVDRAKSLGGARRLLDFLRFALLDPAPRQPHGLPPQPTSLPEGARRGLRDGKRGEKNLRIQPFPDLLVIERQG